MIAVTIPREPNDPLNQEYTLNYRGVNIMIEGIFLNYERGIGLSGKSGTLNSVLAIEASRWDPKPLCRGP